MQRYSTGRAAVTYPNICQNQTACSDKCRQGWHECQNKCGYNSQCLNACTGGCNACVLRDASQAQGAGGAAATRLAYLRP